MSTSIDAFRRCFEGAFKFARDYAICGRKAEDQAPRAKFAQSGRKAVLGPRRLVNLEERAGLAAKRFCLVGLRYCLATVAAHRDRGSAIWEH
jgi:hypothetical protein